MITAVHLGCKSVTIPVDPKSSKGSFLSKTRVWTDMSVPLFIKQSGGGTKRGTSASTELVLVYWIWLWLVEKSGARGGKGMSVMQVGGRRRGLYKVFVLTAVMYGVAGDDHRRGHGNGSATHAELVGDRIICTAAARLASSGSWEEGDKQGCRIISNSNLRFLYAYQCRNKIDSNLAK